MRMLLRFMLLLAFALHAGAGDAPSKKAMPKTWAKDKPGEKLEGRWPAHTPVMPTKRTGTIAFGDWVDDKEVTYKLSARLSFLVLKDNGDGWVRIFDGRNAGWVRKDELVPEADAMEYWEKVIEADPKSAWAYCSRGKWRHLASKSDDAVADYTEAIRIDPKLTEAYLHRGSLQKVRSKAIADFDELIRIDPKCADAYFRRGLERSLNKESDKALSDLSESIRLDPSNVDAILCRGYEHADRCRYEKALIDFEEVLKLDPENADALCARGDMRAVGKDYDKAIADYNAAIEIRPDHARTFAYRGGIWSRKKEFAKALADCEEAIRLDPKEPNSYINRGFTRFEMKEYEKAIADYETALKLDPKSASAFGNKSLTLVKLKKPAEALELLEKAIQLDPAPWMHRDHALFLATYPDAKFRDGRKAVEAAKLAFEKKGKNADWEFFAALAAAYAETGDFDLAMAEQKKAIADEHIHPTDKKEMVARLELFRAKKPYRDE